MALKSVNPTETKAWSKLTNHYNALKNQTLKGFFNQDPERGKKFNIEAEGILYDYSKNLIQEETLSLLIELAEEVGLKEAIEKYFYGDLINETEERAVLHTALRSFENRPVSKAREDEVEEILKTKEEIKKFSKKIISGEYRGYTGKPFTDIVNIGIGGSDLGPSMVVDALQFYKNHLNIHFVSNVDGDHVQEILKKINFETTLFIIVSKTFTTLETITNAETIKSQFLRKIDADHIAKHFVAVSSNIGKVLEFGIEEKNIFPMWDWVGGRFSLWSAVGLSISLAVGFDNFNRLLLGANQLDKHFQESDFKENIPVVMALISIWYNNFYKCETEAIVPYSHYLQKLVPYLQQGIMESNGKCVDRKGEKIKYQTGTIIWGEVGTNSQHAFFQLLHQGTKLIPVDFIGFKKALYGNEEHHQKLMSNFFAQTEALLMGKDENKIREELLLKKNSFKTIEHLTPYKIFEGNKPTSTFLLETLSPENLGKLIALYEHKIFIQGVIWNIFSFDQWGVELGKQLANNILEEIKTQNIKEHDSSTSFLLSKFIG